MRPLIILLIASALCATACSADAADRESEPWIVTGTTFDLNEASADLRVEYTIPTGGTSEWRASMSASSFTDGDSFREWGPYACWKQAIIGSPLPECLTSASPAP